MNNDFVRKDGALYVGGAPGEASMEEVISNVVTLAADKYFLLRIKTSDRHPRGHIEERIYGPHVVRGTKGAKYIDELNARWEDIHSVKGGNKDLVSYSIAVAPDFGDIVSAFRFHCIKRIFVCGVAYDKCVGESAIALAAQFVPFGVEVYVVRDATRSVSPPYGDPEVMAKKLPLYGVKEIFMADIA